MSELVGVTAIGSCRILNPMRIACRAETVSLRNTGIYGYAHTPRELSQMLDYLEGVDIPPDIVPLLTGDRPLAAREPRAEPSAYLVEVSSLKSIQYGDWALQLNYFSERYGRHPSLLEAFQQAPAAEDRDRRAVALAGLPAFRDVDASDRHILVESYVSSLSQEEFEADLRALLARLRRPTVLVSHVDIPDEAGRNIGARALLRDWMGKIGRTHGVRVFDPTLSVYAFGVDRAMDQDGRSRSHYTSDFESALATELVAELVAAASGVPHSVAGIDVADGSRLYAVPARETDLADLRNRVAERMQANDLSEAARQLRGGIAEDPRLVAPITMLAQLAIRSGRHADALAHAEGALALSPSDTGAFAIKAKALTKLNRFEEAAVVWRALAAHRRSLGRPLIEAARCELRAKRSAAALEDAEAALVREPDDPLALAVKAEALNMAGQIEQLAPVAEALAAKAPAAALAIAQWLIAAEVFGPLSGIARAVRGSAVSVDCPEIVEQLRQHATQALERQDWTRAGECLRAVLALSPDDRTARRSMSELMKHLIETARNKARDGNLPEAAAAYDLALTVDPDHARTLKEAASLADKRQDPPRAATLWERVCEDPAAETHALVKAARAAEHCGRDEAAFAFLCRASAASPDDQRIGSSLQSLLRRLTKRARSHEESGDTDEATRLAKLVLAEDRGNAVCERIVRRCGSRLAGRLREAVAAGDEAEQESVATRLLKINPDRFDALRVLSRSRLTDRRWGEAADLLRRLTIVQSEQPAHWIKLGRCLRIMKSYDEARDAIEQALVRDPASVAARKMLAELGDAHPC